MLSWGAELGGLASTMPSDFDPLLARLGHARVSLPGGCAIGVRPIDLHRKGIEALNATTRVEHGYVIAQTDGLRGADIYLGGPFGPTVLGTDNVMMAATLADGETIIENAAQEPEVVDLANFCRAMGARIRGAGTGRACRHVRACDC